MRLRGAFSGRLLSGPFHWRIVEFRRVWACHALKEILRDVPIPRYKFGSKSFTVSPEKSNRKHAVRTKSNRVRKRA